MFVVVNVQKVSVVQRVQEITFSSETNVFEIFVQKVSDVQRV